MRSVCLSVGTILLIAIGQIKAQTSTNCNPLEKSCPPNPGLGTSIFTDFTTGKSDYWKPLEGTTPKYEPNAGVQFNIKVATDAPTIAMTKYIMFGRVEMVAKSSPGTGIVSSFVLLSQDLDEIDWEWLGGDNGNVQTNFFGKGDTSSYDRSTTIPVKTPIDTFHTYTIDWTAERIIWQIDGTPVRTVAYTDPITKGGKIYPQTPMEVKVGSWIGCLDASNPQTSGTCQWAGGQTDLSKGPFTMTIKSINVTDYGCGGDYSYSDNSGSYQSIKSTGKCDGKGTGPGSNIEVKPELDPEPGKGPGFAPGTSPEGLKPVTVPSPSPASPSTTTKGSGAPMNPGMLPGNSTSPQTGKSTGKPGLNGTGSSDAGSIKSNGSTSPETTSNANGKSNYAYRKTDILVGILGLGLGYLFM